MVAICYGSSKTTTTVAMKVTSTELTDVFLLEPLVFRDERGFFLETWNAHTFRDEVKLDVQFVQDNHSRSARGVLRGLHYQIRQPQGKLVRVTRGRIFDVAVDLRKSDRKSTRLNSSHLGISYAVFCLKKKKHEPDIRQRQHRVRPVERRRQRAQCHHRRAVRQGIGRLGPRSAHDRTTEYATRCTHTRC